DQGTGIIEEHFLRHPGEVIEGRLDAIKPGRLPLMLESPHEEPPRIAERRHKQVEPHALAADRHPRLAEVDLQLMPRRCLKTKRRPRPRPQRLPQGCNRPLDRPQADFEPLLAIEILAHDVGVATMLAKPLPQPLLQTIELLRPPRRPVAHIAPSRQITANRPT